ncbi:MAG: RDD family protein [bacterium]
MGKKDKKPKPPQIRPAWIMRLCATFLDFGVCVSGVAAIHSNLLNAISTPLILAFYYWACEFFFSRTPGKMILRMKITDKKGDPPTRLRLGMRTFLRVAIAVVALFSWRRVTLLDLLSGCRVMKIDVEPAVEKSVKLLPKEPVVGWR